MNRTIAMEWIEALRSGKYAQCREGALKVHPEGADCQHCCLGVLCELAIEAGVQIESRIHGVTHFMFIDAEREFVPNDVQVGRYSMAYLPERVVLWAGMASRDGGFDNRTLVGGGEFYSLVEANDNKLVDFNDIASYIEANYDQL